MNLVGPFDDLIELRVTHHSLDRELLRVAVAAQHLHRFGRDLHRDIGHEALGNRRDHVQPRVVARVYFIGAVVEQIAGGLDLDRHVGELELHALELRDGAPELLALLCIRDRNVKRTLGKSERGGGDGRTVQVQHFHAGLETLTFLAEQAIRVDAHVVEEEFVVRRPIAAHLVFLAAEAKAGCLRIDEKCADAVRPTRLRRACEEQHVMRVPTPRDPVLLSVDHIRIAVLHRSRADGRHVGTGLRLGHRDRRHETPFSGKRQPPLLLFLGAVMQDRQDERDRIVSAQGRGRERHLGDLLLDDTHGLQVSARSSILLRQPQLQEAHVTEDRDQFRRKAVALFHAGHERHDVLLDHPANRVLDRNQFFIETHNHSVSRCCFARPINTINNPGRKDRH